MNINPILTKLVSESLLSLYPSFVKNIDLPLDTQLWSRLITYTMISIFFINYSYIAKNILSYEGIMLSMVNLIHIYSLYEAFNNLDSGVALSVYNIYPLLILLLSGVLWKSSYILSIIAIILFIYGNYENINKSSTENFNYGMIMVLIAALTEAVIYFIVKEIPTGNGWNELFISYFLSSILMSIYMSKKDKLLDTRSDITLVILSLIINGIIGCIGNYLRFYSINNLDVETYSVLSDMGIVMAYIYGLIFNNEHISIYKIIATIMIIYSNYIAI